MKLSVFSSLALSLVIFMTGVIVKTSVNAQNPIMATKPSRQFSLDAASIPEPIYIAQANPTESLDSLEQAVYNQVNQYRTSNGLPPLTLDSRISEQARNHSQDMANGQVPFGHDGFQSRIQAIEEIIPLSAAAENAAYNQGYSDPASVAVQGWLKSPGHLTNIKGQYNLTGIGVAKNVQGAYYFTQIFINSSQN